VRTFASTFGGAPADAIGVILSLLLVVAPQSPAPAVPAPMPAAPLGTRFDERGWPIVDEPPPRASAVPPATPAAEARPAPATAAPRGGPDTGAATLDAVFAAAGTPHAFRGLGGVSIAWRLTVYGPQGETIGIREVTQLLDPSVPDHDRLEFADGRVCGRFGNTVFAERHGLPWPTLVEASTHELALFGLHARMPWILADRQLYVAVAAEPAATAGSAVRLRLAGRRADGSMGPDPAPREGVDRIELLCPGSGPPSELLHEFACSHQLRRVRLEDWRTVGGVMMPFRRTYLDAADRPSTALEMLRVATEQPLPAAAFRLQ
jgi:hypothetical protein